MLKSIDDNGVDKRKWVKKFFAKFVQVFSLLHLLSSLIPHFISRKILPDCTFACQIETSHSAAKKWRWRVDEQSKTHITRSHKPSINCQLRFLSKLMRSDDAKKRTFIFTGKKEVNCNGCKPTIKPCSHFSRVRVNKHQVKTSLKED